MKQNLLMIIMIVMIMPGIALAQGTNVNYTDGATKLTGYFVKAKTSGAAKAPGVVVLHQWMGLTAHEKTSATKLAALGYHALAADVYGTGMTPKDMKEAGEKAGYYKTNFEVYQSRIKAAIAELIKQGADPARIAVIGYCFGGTGAIEAARAGMPVKGVVSFHGGLGKAETRPNIPITTKVLVLHGADDPYESEAEIKKFQQEMREGKADWQMVYFANAVHAFTQVEAGNDNSKGAAYNEKAARRSWEYMNLFLAEVFAK
ncbi:dienelactone hydrolase family protein [Mucilaginibacter glaciei]|uniref:Dienelactone hydrolase family protein n=1 Tax=Mucilaginibacter glaciei TaxID=2772109 RepID=A0A926NP27_9SPHI|nr:dienelactone hydrolase family protein [Mucilaginibacter glaciei]MBD1392793.1 dienelactone hydrolase family protein [Mucilaginibacter glaciei]